MTDEIIKFDTAKLAKEKGFGLMTFYYCTKEGKLVEPSIENGSSTDVEFKVYLTEFLENHNGKYSTTFSAPTQSLLQRWLREKHNINITIVSGKLGKQWEFILTHIDKVDSFHEYKEFYHSAIGNFISYEEALEVGLVAALKLIKV